MSEIIIGIDPGQNGGVAIHYPVRVCGYGLLAAATFVTFSFSKQTEYEIRDWLEEKLKDEPRARTFAYLEHSSPMPKQGVVSTFKFGQGYGFLRGLLVALKIPFETVRPARWQRTLGCLSRGDKNVTKAKAQELFPGIRITHAIADALLIAEYGRRTRLGEQKEQRK